MEVQELQRDQSLVVVHRDYRVEFAGDRLMKQRIGRIRPAGVRTVAARPFDRGLDDATLLAAEKSVLTRVRIEARDRDAGLGQAMITAEVIGGYRDCARDAT